MKEEYREVYAQTVRLLEETRNNFAPVFRELVKGVEDNGLYSRGSLAKRAKELGIIDQEKARILSILLGSIQQRAGFSDDGDGTIKPHGVPLPAWYGMRWKAALGQAVTEVLH